MSQCPHDIRTEEAKRRGLDVNNGIAIVDFSGRVEASQLALYVELLLNPPIPSHPLKLVINAADFLLYFSHLMLN